MKAKLAYYRKVFSEAVSGDIPVYLLTGQEQFIMAEMAERIVTAIAGPENSGFNLEIHYGAEVEIDSLISTANSFPFLGDKRVIVLRELNKFKGPWKNLLAYLEDPSPTTVLVLIFNSHDEEGRRIRAPKEFQNLVKAVDRKGKVIKFDPLRGEDMKNWIRQKGAKMGVEMSDSQAAALLSSVGDDLFSIKNELEKISLVFEGSKVSDEDIASVIGKYRMNALGDFLGSLEPGKEKESLRLLYGIITSGAERVSVVIYHMIRYFLALLKIKAGMRTGGYMQDGLRLKAELFTTGWIMLWLENLRTAEILLKSVSFPDELLLESAVLHSMKGKYMADRAPGA